MSVNITISAAQECRSHLRITSKTRATVTGEIEGNVYDIIVTQDTNEIAFDFDEVKIRGFSRFSTKFQDMQWDADGFILTISSDSPEYEFEINFK